MEASKITKLLGAKANSEATFALEFKEDGASLLIQKEDSLTVIKADGVLGGDFEYGETYQVNREAFADAFAVIPRSADVIFVLSRENGCRTLRASCEFTPPGRNAKARTASVLIDFSPLG